MKTLKKVAAVLAASMALNAVAFTGAFSASAEEDVTVIGTASLKGQMGTYGYWGEGNTGNSFVILQISRCRSQTKTSSILHLGRSPVMALDLSNS